MPTTYAHYRFGCDVFHQLPPTLQSLVQQHRTFYDFGVHGPDLLFYYNPFTRNRVNRLGSECHTRTGRSFFTQAVKAANASLRPAAATAYLLGVLCHFTLDRECHPYVGQKEKDGVTHSAIEASFDRFLMEQDGLDPLRHRVTQHLHPSHASALEISAFYPPLSSGDILSAERSMLFFLNALIAPPGLKRTAIEGTLRRVGAGSMADLLIPLEPNKACADSDESLFAHYQDALELAKVLVPELISFQAGRGELGPGFDHTFGET